MKGHKGQQPTPSTNIQSFPSHTHRTHADWNASKHTHGSFHVEEKVELNCKDALAFEKLEKAKRRALGLEKHVSNLKASLDERWESIHVSFEELENYEGKLIGQDVALFRKRAGRRMEDLEQRVLALLHADSMAIEEIIFKVGEI